MALHPQFPKSPYAILEPEVRWIPADEDLRERGYEKLLPPLVAKLRKAVREWRNQGYAGATDTSRALLSWWFESPHPVWGADGTVTEFRYYFAQREAVETVVYLHEMAKVRRPTDLIPFDSSGVVVPSRFEETWVRLVLKMATGSGKTKVMSLLMAWSYFNREYEGDTTLARNFLLIAPNIIVLDRLRTDFDGARIFLADPVLPENGFRDRNWRDDFQLSVHLQDEVRNTRRTGNLYLTNIHRVYENREAPPAFEDEDRTGYFLGREAAVKATDSGLDVGEIVRQVDEMMVLNDEAHHVHDPDLTWYQSIRDIHHHLVQKGLGLSMQIDLTATPKDVNGGIFIQTVSDYPLVEAIHQNVVKHPVVPDPASRAKLKEHRSVKYAEKYADYLKLGFLEWKKAYREHEKLGKKAVLFIMTDDTRNCDDVAAWLEREFPELQGAVLVIHTNRGGDIKEAAKGADKEELDKLRRQANTIDTWESPYKAVVSVLMLKEGWDVRNVTTIVGLRAFSGKAAILPEQTLGRGLRRMYFGENIPEIVSVVGTDLFMEFVDGIRSEGVLLERARMGEGTGPKTPLVIEVEKDNPEKPVDKLDIRIPNLAPRLAREYKNLSSLDPAKFGIAKLKLRGFSEKEQKEIVFRFVETGETSHITDLAGEGALDPGNVLGYFARNLMKELRLVSGYEILYGKVKDFVENHLFDQIVDVHELNVLRNLSESHAVKKVFETFRERINALTVVDRGEARIQNQIAISECRTFTMKHQPMFQPRRSLFNKIAPDSGLEMAFARFLDSDPCNDILSFAKNYPSLGFKIDYQKPDGSLSNYYPDFFIKRTESEIYIVETKGREDVDVPLKMARLKQWCEDANTSQSKVMFQSLYIPEGDFYRYSPKTFTELLGLFPTGRVPEQSEVADDPAAGPEMQADSIGEPEWLMVAEPAAGISEEDPSTEKDQTSRNGKSGKAARKERETLDRVEISADDLVEDYLPAFRSVLRGSGSMSEDGLFKAVSRHLGQGRIGPNIRLHLEGALRLAIRRRIVAKRDEEYLLATPTLQRYEDEFLRSALVKVMRKGIGYDRDEVCKNLTRHLGYSQATEAMKERFKSIFNSAIRRGFLEKDGSKLVRR